jgi:DNA-binding IscR family transcriptional regulator
VLEGSVSFVSSEKVQEENQGSIFKVTHGVWLELEEKIVKILSSITLADLIERYRETESIESLNFNI